MCNNDKLLYFEYSFVGLNKLKSLDILKNDLIHSWAPRTFSGLNSSTNILVDDIIPPSLLKKDSDPLILLCSHEDIVSSLEVKSNVENLRDAAQNCSRTDLADIIDSTLWLHGRGIKGFAKGWYHLHDLTIHSLHLSNNEISRVTSEMLDDLPKDLTRVNLNYKFIEHLEQRIIINENVRFLDFTHNSINEIEDDSLVMKNLIHLSLAHNRLRNITFVATLPSTLHEIFLDFNNIEQLSPVTFSRFNNLVLLHLHENKITEIKRDLLSGLSLLKELRLESKHVKKIESGTFRDLKSLEYINLKKNNLSSLEKGVFDGLANVYKVNIAENQLKIITNESLRGFSDNMRSLDLSCNKIERLRNGTFVNAPTSELYLDHNKIMEIEDESFNLPKLEYLRIDRNVVNILKTHPLAGSPNLKISLTGKRYKRI